MIKQKPSAIVLAVIAALGRLLPHPPNFTPVGGAALFGGANLKRPWNYLLPIAIMFITDLFLGLDNTLPYVYISFFIIVFLGERFLNKDSSMLKVSGVSLLGSVLFYLITNFGVWQIGGLYPHTTAGFVQCYVLAIPFLKWTVLGDLIYSNGFFTLYKFAQNSQVTQRFDKNILHWLR